MQVGRLSLQIRLRLDTSMVDWYYDATSVPLGHIDLSPRTDDLLG